MPRGSEQIRGRVRDVRERGANPVGSPPLSTPHNPRAAKAASRSRPAPMPRGQPEPKAAARRSRSLAGRGQGCSEDHTRAPFSRGSFPDISIKTSMRLSDRDSGPGSARLVPLYQRTVSSRKSWG